MEEGKLFLSITVLYCHEYLNFFRRRSFCQVKWLRIKPFSTFVQRLRERHFLNFLDCWWLSLVSLCNSNRWLAVISLNLTDTDVIVVSSEDSVRLLFMYFFYSILRSVLLGRSSLGDWQLYLPHAFTPISRSGLKPTILFGYYGSCLCSSKTK